MLWRRRRLPGDFDARVVWVLGSPRSGSTWLLKMLAEQPDVVPINEPLIGLYLSPFISDLPGWDGEKLDRTNFTLRMIQSDKRDQFFAAEFDSVAVPALGSLIRKRFRAQALRYPPANGLGRRTRVVVKEPSGSQSADLLLRALPSSRLLFLMRDGRDVVDSELSANLKGSWVSSEFPGARGLDDQDRVAFIEQAARKWLWRTEVVADAYAAHVGPKHQVKYEDLLADPQTRLREILEWMGLPAEPNAVQATCESHSFSGLAAEERGVDKFYRSASPGLWREHLTGAEQEVLGRVIGPKLRELGYEP